MKKLATIGIVFAGLLLSTGVAWAKPTGMTKAEYHALMVRSEGLNLKYGLGDTQTVPVNQKLEEIGSWAVPSEQQDSATLVSEKLGGLGLATPQPSLTTTGGFDWNDAGIGAGIALVGLLGVGAVLAVRHQHTPIAH